MAPISSLAGGGISTVRSPAPKPFDRTDQAAQARHDRVQDDESEQDRGDYRGDVDIERQPRRESDVGDDAVAPRADLAVQLIDECGEQVVDLDAALACLCQQLVAEDAVVCRVFVDRIVGGFLVSSALGAQLGDELRLAVTQRIEEAIHAFAGCRGVALGRREQADSEIGEPVAHLAKGDARAVCRVDRAAQFACLHHGV